MSLQAANIQRVQELVAEFMNGNNAGYLDGVHDDIKGSVLGGLIPGAEDIKSKTDFIAVMEKMGDYMEVKSFTPSGWRAVGDDVLFNVEWKFVWKPTGKEVETTALVRKVVKERMICEKYHMVDVAEITGVEQAPVHDVSTVERVKELLAEFQAGRPEGYMVGVADNVKADMLGGLIPGADRVQSKDDFGAVMGQLDKYMEVTQFEPCNFRALPNSDMMMNVKWKFVWKPTGKEVETMAIVRKVLDEQNNICEKYHMIDVDAVTQESPRDVISSEA